MRESEIFYNIIIYIQLGALKTRTHTSMRSHTHRHTRLYTIAAAALSCQLFENYFINPRERVLARENSGAVQEHTPYARCRQAIVFLFYLFAVYSVEQFIGGQFDSFGNRRILCVCVCGQAITLYASS